MRNPREIFEQIGEMATSDGQFAIAFAIHELAGEVAQYRRDMVGSALSGPGMLDALVERLQHVAVNLDGIASSIGQVASAIEERG